ncbi:hypothetical protein [Puia dinghuensis]|uniref:Uncharacterized protein n=1 Tax=Puia dinghuensis TaxID=1792502 RepID=A0A8J2UGN8_9BACT|nr:hypothetical protein [Puia dinghuensis]GGB12940.1 hypothetical protein GCM10011511_40740 [Puia dinghuensis]
MKIFFFLSLFLPGLFFSETSKTFIDPTGTYILKGEVHDNKVVSHSGEIRVKLLRPEQLTLCFYLDKGYPRYESGSLLDTLRYDDNQAVYVSKDSDCMLRFYFKPNGVELIHVFSQAGSDCGFPPGVLIGAFFRKTSSGIPVIQDLSGHKVAVGY